MSRPDRGRTSTRRRVRFLGIGLALALGAAAAIFFVGRARWEGPDPAETRDRHANASSSGIASPLPPVSARDPEDEAVRALARGPLPRSLRGTDVDGALATDADGHFLPTPDAIALFDYFLAASGEEPAAVIEQRIRDAIDERLAPEAAAEAVALLEAYLAYRDEARTLAASDAVPAELERRLQWIRELRRRHFGAEVAAALYGEVEQVAVLDLERRRVATDPDLAPDARAEALDRLSEQLPERVREARERARSPQRVHEEVAALRAEGAAPREIFAARERAFGSEAAERLGRLDEARADFQARLAEYRSARDALRAEPASQPRDAALDRLRARYFPDEREREQVRHMDRFDG